MDKKSPSPWRELKAELKAAKLKQSWAAIQLGITSGHLSQAMQGKAPVSPELLERAKKLTARLQAADWMKVS